MFMVYDALTSQNSASIPAKLPKLCGLPLSCYRPSIKWQKGHFFRFRSQKLDFVRDNSAQACVTSLLVLTASWLSLRRGSGDWHELWTL